MPIPVWQWLIICRFYMPLKLLSSCKRFDKIMKFQYFGEADFFYFCISTAELSLEYECQFLSVYLLGHVNKWQSSIFFYFWKQRQSQIMLYFARVLSPISVNCSTSLGRGTSNPCAKFELDRCIFASRKIFTTDIAQTHRQSCLKFDPDQEYV